MDRNRVMPPHSIRFDYIVFKRYAFGVIFLEPSARSFFVRKNFEMAGVANTVSGVDIDPNGCHWSLLSFRFPQWVSLREESTSGTTFRFSALNIQIRACIGGPRFSAAITQAPEARHVAASPYSWDQRTSRSRASSTTCSPDKTAFTNGGCGEV